METTKVDVLIFLLAMMLVAKETRATFSFSGKWSCLRENGCRSVRNSSQDHSGLITLELENEYNLTTDYPVDQITRLIQRNPDYYKEHFFVEKESEDITSRFNDDPVHVFPLCETTEDLIVPTKEKRVSDGKEVFIANDFTNKILQKVRRVVCRTATCLNPELLPVQYTSFCKQEFHERKLYVYDEEKITTEVFAFPSCCTCNYRRN